MNEELIKKLDDCYGTAEQKAAHYFQILHEQAMQKNYVVTLTKDFQAWKHKHIKYHSFLSFFSQREGKADSQGYYHYIRWLDYKGKLDDYLERSISYIFLRDLGKSLDSVETKTRIQHIVEDLKNHLTQSAAEGREDKNNLLSIASLYRWAQRENIESTMIWLLDKLKTVASNIPQGLDAEQARRKLIKLIAGVILHEIEEMGAGVSPEERARRLDEAIRLGYSYGLTYPFIDDLLDSSVLSPNEKRQYSNFIRTTLITGDVPELGKWTGQNSNLIVFIHSELRDAFQYIKANLQNEARKHFFEQAYVFFHSQEQDREKDLSNPNYNNEELYLPVIIKSASSRLIVRSVISASEDKDFENKTFFYGIYNQLADDFADMFEDMKAGAVTPYTYYLKYHSKRKDLINPFELYWTVISHLIHNVYGSDSKTAEVILDRAINGLKRYKKRMGIQKYNEVMELFSTGNLKFNKMVQKMVKRAGDVEFYDKLLRDYTITTFKNERKEKEEFLDTIEKVRDQINHILPIPNTNSGSLIKEPIIDAANYSLEGSGKRLRAIMTWVMGVNEYGLKESAIVPLVKSLEYMHTASLIYDDLPSQDNASIRRGRSTLHGVYNTAIAELTALFLTQKAIEEQTLLHGIDSKAVLNLIQYSARITQEMCKGQAMDLGAKGKPLTLEQLNTMSYYKTGLAFEASLIGPAILAKTSMSEMNDLKKFARHAGIAFQIKDDLLDVEGDLSILGKPIGKDAENNNSTFVSILGTDGARKALWDHYCFAIEVLHEVPRNTAFLKHLMDYLVNRDH